MATGDPLILGKSNLADAGTYLIRKTPRQGNTGPTLWLQCVDNSSTALRADSAGTASGPAVSAYGFNFATAVRGQSERGIAVYGESSSTGVGVMGDGRRGLAGLFLGDVRVSGNLDVWGGTKSAVVELPDGTMRRLYCVESPESWFEDFGEARLVRGRATVRLDAQFASLVRGPYHVFLTSYGESSGLFVSRRTAKSFDVREQSQGRSSLTFSYRIVAKRKDVGAPRMAKVKQASVKRPPQEQRDRRPASARAAKG